MPIRSFTVIVAHGPHIIGCESRQATGHFVDLTRVRAGHDAPSRAVPVLDQRLGRVATYVIIADGPGIIECETCNTVEITLGPWVGAVDFHPHRDAARRGGENSARRPSTGIRD